MRNFFLGIIATVGFVVFGQFARSFDMMGAMGGREPIFGPVHFLMENGASVLVLSLVILGICSLFGKGKEDEKSNMPPGVTSTS